MLSRMRPQRWLVKLRWSRPRLARNSLRRRRPLVIQHCLMPPQERRGPSGRRPPRQRNTNDFPTSGRQSDGNEMPSRQRRPRIARNSKAPLSRRRRHRRLPGPKSRGSAGAKPRLGARTTGYWLRPRLRRWNKLRYGARTTACARRRHGDHRWRTRRRRLRGKSRRLPTARARGRRRVP